MWLIPVAIVVTGAILFFYGYTHFLLGRKTDLKWCIVPGLLYTTGVYIRIPFQASVMGYLPAGDPATMPFSTLWWAWVIMVAAMFVTTIDQTLTRGIWFLPFRALRRKLFTDLVSVLELGAVAGVGSLISGTILIGYLGGEWLATPSWNWLGFIGERLIVIVAYIALPTLHLYTMHLYKTTGRSAVKGWTLGCIKVIALHTFTNGSLVWLGFRDIHWTFFLLFQLQFVAALLVLLAYWYRMYAAALEQERTLANQDM